MGDLYLVEAADWLRAAGLTVVEYDDWPYRAKSSGGYSSGRPWGCMWHHTGSNNSAESEAYYMCYVADAAPIANVAIDRDGTVWLLAGGPTNTNGSGYGDVHWSKGKVPDDSMNSYAFGIEICNNGGGQAYPQAQVDAAFVVSNVINAHCGNQPTDVCTHYVWAPDRKVDPSRASAVEGPWQPGSCTGSGTWELTDIMAESQRRSSGVGPAPTPPQEDEMVFVEIEDAWARFVGVGQREPLVLWQVGYVSNEGGNPRADVYSANLPHVTVTKAQLSGCTLLGALPPADDGGGPARWGPNDFFEVIT